MFSYEQGDISHWLIKPNHVVLTELELSAHDHGEVRSFVFLMSIADPYVPAIIKKVPETITKTAKDAIAYQRAFLG